MEYEPEQIRAAISKILEKHKLSPQQFAEAIRFGEGNTIEAWITGRSVPSEKAIEMIEEFLYPGELKNFIEEGQK